MHDLLQHQVGRWISLDTFKPWEERAEKLEYWSAADVVGEAELSEFKIRVL
jgi:hypothetical protein